MLVAYRTSSAFQHISASVALVMEAGASSGGYEHAYASQAVYSKDIASMSREERQKIIQDYQV